jgi:hypothetical protein
MKEEDYLSATGIIMRSNSPKVSFRVPVRDNYSNVYDILIHSCNADLINKLKEAGFFLSMCDKGLAVDKY